ncbi:MAG: acyl-CoA dehydrogenase family protein [Hyphomonadaceae bacterium]
MVDLVLSSDQQQVVDGVRDFLADKAPLARLRPGASERRDTDLWPAMGEMGWFMMALPEADGGVGMSVVEEALVFREFGRRVLTPCVLAQTLGARVALAAGKSDAAAQIASGGVRVAFANALGPATIGAATSGRFHIFDGAVAPYVFAIAEDGAAALIERRSLNDVTAVNSAVDGVEIEAASLEGAPAFATAPASAGLHTLARLFAASMLAGVCEATRDLATEYAKVRNQFGQPIGAFQAIKHKCADMALRAEAVGALTNFASIAVATQRDDAAFQATSAKLLAGQYALLSAKETIQVHGGIGFTVECDAHHFLKRAHLYDQIAGNSRRQQRLLLQTPAPAPEAAA